MQPLRLKHDYHDDWLTQVEWRGTELWLSFERGAKILVFGGVENAKQVRAALAEIEASAKLREYRNGLAEVIALLRNPDRSYSVATHNGVLNVQCTSVFEA